ncbi:hypothetical protein RCL1_003884 [Eukaryota sp. TZLM3-RCL]
MSTIPRQRVSGKDIHVRNQRHLKILASIAAGVNLFFLFVLYLRWRKYTFFNKFLTFIYFAINAGVLKYFQFSAKPVRDEAGKVSFATDIKEFSMFHDALYITWFSQLFALVTKYSWLPLLYFPLYGSYKLFGFIKTYVFTPTADELMTDEEKEALQKQRERAARRRRGAKKMR